MALGIRRISSELGVHRASGIQRFWFEEILLLPNRMRITETFEALEKAASGLQEALASSGAKDGADRAETGSEVEAAQRFRRTCGGHLNELTARVVDPLGAVSPPGRNELREILTRLSADLDPGSPPDVQRLGPMQAAVRDARVSFLTVLHDRHLEAVGASPISGRERRPEKAQKELPARRSPVDGLRASPRVVVLVFLLSLGTWLLFYANPDERLDAGATAVVVGFWRVVVLGGRWLLSRVRG